jgi:hypothetical protein
MGRPRRDLKGVCAAFARARVNLAHPGSIVLRSLAPARRPAVTWAVVDVRLRLHGRKAGRVVKVVLRCADPVA